MKKTKTFLLNNILSISIALIVILVILVIIGLVFYASALYGALGTGILTIVGWVAICIFGGKSEDTDSLANKMEEKKVKKEKGNLRKKNKFS